ncbi:hypothetical protein I3900191A7_03680 [Clostridium baratii]|uniref:type II secretion system protein n=1 Tax=Clostridium baratii TaxID=1561 RepID=UPI0024308134|nr:type II secretion system protein [Clostridium baratii]MBS6041869.1 type II secretion system protein [Clostridium baratii]
MKILNKNKKKKGFTLIELIAVVAIIGILAAILVPKISGYMMQAKKTKVLDQARKIVTAVESYNLKRDSADKMPNTKKVSELQATSGVKDLIADETFTNLTTDATVKNCYDIVQGQADFDFTSGTETLNTASIKVAVGYTAYFGTVDKATS